MRYTRGNDSWKIRFTPDETGTWTYFLKCTDSTGSAEYTGGFFNCMPSGNKGFIRKSSTDFFRFDNGSSFFAIGENVCWYGEDKIYDYKKWIDELADNVANFLRLLKIKINRPSNIEISVENYLDQQMKSFRRGFYSLGCYKLNWDINDLSTGDSIT